MMENVNLLTAVGLIVGVFAIPLLARMAMALVVQVEDEQAVLVTVFGAHTRTLREPGIHFLPSKVFPWVALRKVSLRRDFLHLQNVPVNDASGTSVSVDLWVEFAVVDPAKVYFGVADWERCLQNVVAHAATAILGNREFRQILCDRVDLGERLREEVREESQRWGLNVDLVMVRNVALLPEVAQNLFATVAAQLERAKADIEESGRLAVAELEARTSARTAELEALAKAEYPTAVGRALAIVKRDAQVYAAYNDLYRLSQIRPHRSVAFLGFDGSLRATEAGMFLPPNGGQPSPTETGAD
jgi:regulator of protease activity HflC (stomatin/prohibitin superfamily)